MLDKFLTMAEGRDLGKAIMYALDDLPDEVSARSLRAIETIYRVIDDATEYPGQGDQREVEALQVLERASRAAPLPGPGVRTDGIVVFTRAEIPGRGEGGAR